MPEQNICTHSLSKLPLPWDSPLSEDMLAKVSIPRNYFPLYFTIPTKSKELFDLPSLRRLWIEKSLCYLYKDKRPPTAAKICLFTWVIGDGLGDFSAQIEAAYSLLSLPIELSLISLHPEKMPLLNPHLQCPHFFIPYQEDSTGTWSHIPYVNISDKVQKVISSCNVFLQMPTYFPYTPDIVRLLSPSTFYELIGEGGWGLTPPFSPVSGFRAMGLQPWEKGLFFAKAVEDPSRTEIDSILIKYPLLTFYFGYLRYPSYCKMFTETVLTIEKNNNNPICLCLFPCETLLQDLEILIPFLKKSNIATLEIYYKQSFCSISIQEKGKQLILIQTEKVARKTYQSLLSKSSSLVGCRGDGSLSETLLAKKIPFFDFPTHKKPLLEGLYSLSDYYLSNSHPTTLYIKEFLEEEPKASKLASLLQNPLLIKGFFQLTPLLSSYYNMEDFVPNLVLRAAYHHFYPWVAIQEKQILEPFLAGKKDPLSTLAEVQAILDESQ